MFRKLIILPVLWMPFFLTAQGVSFSMDDPSVRERIVQDMAVLASDSLEGRQSGTEGERRAARYLCAQFAAIGLQPKGDTAGSYCQRFSKYEVGYHWSTRLVVNEVPYVYREAFGVTALSMNGHGLGTLVDGRQGLVIPELKIDQLSGLGDLKGKFVLMDLHASENLVKDTSVVSKLTPRFRMMSALRKGALGVIFWNPDSPWFTGLFDFESSDTLPGLALYVNRATAEQIIKNSGAKAEVNVQISRKTIVCSNVVGMIANHAPRTIVIGAHYDHLGLKNGNKIFSGADDNASGTAGMLEVARYFAVHRDTLNNYLFIGFTGEEEGLWGSGYFVKHPAIPLDSIRFMLNLDMIGRLGCEGNRVEIEAAGSSAEWHDILQNTPHPGFSLKKVNASLPYSDHDPFYKAKIPVLFINTGLHDDYHTVRDKASTINYDGMVEIMRFAEGIITSSNQEDSIRYRQVPFTAQASASFGFFFQALDWLFTAKN